MQRVTETSDIVLHHLCEITSAEPGDLTLNQSIFELGMDSLSMARLFIQLEQAIGVDPFAEGTYSILDVQTIGDLVGVYDSALDEMARTALVD